MSDLQSIADIFGEPVVPSDFLGQVDYLLAGELGPKQEVAQVRKAAQELETLHAKAPFRSMFLTWVRIQVDGWAHGKHLATYPWQWEVEGDTARNANREARVNNAVDCLMHNAPDDVVRAMCYCEFEYEDACLKYMKESRIIAAPVQSWEQGVLD